jgi:hypothetical protein
MSSVARQTTTTAGTGGTTAPRRLVPAQSVIATRPAIPVSVLLLGLVAMLVAAWGAAAPFAGPDFGFVADRATAWQWSVTSACLGLGPGALAFLAAVIVVAASTRTSYARRADLWLLGFVVTLCGAWFVVGQYVWPVIYGRLYIAPSNVTHFMWKELAFAIGPGVILVFCGAVFMGWAVRRQLALVADRYPRSTVAPAAAPTGTVRPRAATPAAARAGTTTGAGRPTTATATGNTGTMAPPVERPVAERPAAAERPVAERPAAERPVAEPVAEPVERPAGQVAPPPA